MKKKEEKSPRECASSTLLEQVLLDILPQLLHPFNIDSYQQLSRQLLGLQPQTAAASLFSLGLKLPASSAEQFLIYLGLQPTKWRLWTYVASDHVIQPSK
jgi:hypothetical protein